MSSRPGGRKKSSRSGGDSRRYGGFKSDGARHSTASSKPYQRRQSSQPKSRWPRSLKRLDYGTFMSLPADIMLRVCRFLYPWNLLALVRTNKGLRARFMKEVSRPYWDATRYLTGMPDWKTVALPQAAAMIYEFECQGQLCSEESKFLALHLCRRYCAKCAQENLLDLEEVVQQFPSAPEDLVKRLPWTSCRPSLTDQSMEKKRFYLKSDVQKLCRRLDALGPLGSKDMSKIARELAGFQRQRKTSTKEVQVWYERDERRHPNRTYRRWTIIGDAMKSRWGWEPIEYRQLAPRLKFIVDYLLDVSTLSEETWRSVRGELECAIREEARFRKGRDDPRRFSLHIPPSAPEGNNS